jgi:ribonuclease PH
VRNDGRHRDDELRRLELLPDFVEQAHGSVLFSQGKTRVLCTASVEERVPRWLHRSGRGWMTAEYSLLPASTGERTLWLDCDVLQADGGTRCAAISGAYVAARRALDRFGLSKALSGQVAAVSVGVVEGRALLDLDYAEDSTAETDMNVVMTADGRLVEVQATAERDPFSRELLDDLLDLAAGGIETIAAAQLVAADANGA